MNSRALRGLSRAAALITMSTVFFTAGAGSVRAGEDYLLRSGDLRISLRRFERVHSVVSVRYADPLERDGKIDEHLKAMRQDLLLATAAKKEGLDKDPEVSALMEKRSSKILRDLFLEREVVGAARAYSRSEEALATGENPRKLFRKESGRLQREALADARGRYKAVIDREALTAAVAGEAENPVVAVVGSREVHYEELLPGLAKVNHPSMKPETRLSVAENVLASHLDGERFLLLATEKGYGKDPDYRADFDDMTVEVLAETYMLKRIFEGIEVTAEEAGKYYDSHREEFRKGVEKEIREILLKDPETARRVRGELIGGGSFDELVEAHSVGMTKDKGGMIGFVGAGQLVSQLDGAVASMQPGEYSQVLRSQYGFHILKCTGVREGRLPPVEEVRALMIDGKIIEEKRQEALRRRVEELEKLFPIEVNDKELKRIRNAA